jgi:hypothetical protein
MPINLKHRVDMKLSQVPGCEIEKCSSKKGPDSVLKSCFFPFQEALITLFIVPAATSHSIHAAAGLLGSHQWRTIDLFNG